MDIIPDRYKQRPISLYNPREAPLLNQYRLVVPRTRNYLEIMHFVVLLGLYLAFMTERDAQQISNLEVCFTVYALGWVLDQFATLLEHGWYATMRREVWLRSKRTVLANAPQGRVRPKPVVVPRRYLRGHLLGLLGHPALRLGNGQSLRRAAGA
jgi:hypothetical protein